MSGARSGPPPVAPTTPAPAGPPWIAPAAHAPASLKRIAPTLAAGVLAVVYVLVSPPSLDLAAHMFRAQLFRAEGFGIWNNWWYAGHHVVGYSVLFPAAAAALSPQLAAAIAATATAALFEPLARRHFGANAWLGALVFGAATATNLFTGRLAFAFGALPATAAVLALDRDRTWLAPALAILTALCSPVAALFAALVGAAHALGAYVRGSAFRTRAQPLTAERDLTAVHPLAAARAGITVAVAALAPVALLAYAFPEGGDEPFAFSTLWPIPLIALGLLLALPADAWKLRAGVVLYTFGTIVAYGVATPIGSNAARLGTFIAAPLAALLCWRRRIVVLILAAPALLYLEWHDPVRDLSIATGDPAASAGYFRPLLGFLARQSGPPFRIEIPFTQFHSEAYRVAPRFPIARGWERQLDLKYNRIFYGGRLTPATYDAWLHDGAIRFVAVSDAQLDYSAEREMALIAGGLAYLRPVFHSRHWQVYAVAHPAPIVQGAATLQTLGPSSLTMRAAGPGTALIRVHFTPYWVLAQGAGCVAPDGAYTIVTIRRPGPVKLVIRVSLGRIGARSSRCR